MAFGRKSKDKERVKLTKESYQKAKRIFSYIKPYRLTFTIGMIFLFLSSVTAMFFPIGTKVVELKAESLESQ